MHSWLNRSEYPFEHHYFSVVKHKLHYIDQGKGDVLLFVHGTPSWSFDWRHLIKHYSRRYRCIAIDHMGFGLSDKPTDYDYTTINHSRTLACLIKELKPENITLVVHDFGGPIGLNFAINNPDIVKRIVVLNSWLWSAEGDEDYKKLKRVLKSPLLPILYKYLNFSARFILPASFGNKKLDKHLRKQYTGPFGKTAERMAPLAFAHSLLHDQQWFEQLWQQKKTIEHKPVLFVWGMKDKVVTPRYLYKFASGFTHARVVKLMGCGHFPQEEEPGEVITAIDSFLAHNKE